MKNIFLFALAHDTRSHIKTLRDFAGKKIYLVLFVSFLASLSEGIGIAMVFPLLAEIEGGIPSDTIPSAYTWWFRVFGGDVGIFYLILIIVAFFLIKSGFLFAADVYKASIRVDLQKQLKGGLYKNFLEMDLKHYLKYDSGYFVNVVNQQSSKFISAAILLISVATAALSSLIYLVIAAFVSWWLALVAVLIGVSILICFKGINAAVKRLSKRQTKVSTKLFGLLIQTIHSLKYIISTGQSSVVEQKVSLALDDLARCEFRTNIAAALAGQIREPVAVITVMTIIGMQVLILQAPLAPIIVSLLLFYKTLNCVLQIQSRWQLFLTLVGAIEIVSRELVSQNKQKEVGGAAVLGELSSGIRFKNVDFSYPGDQALFFSRLNLEIPVNQTTAIVGRSGSGKSTIVNMLTLALRPTGGSILFDDIQHDELALGGWRRQIGLVAQETAIFDATITENICMWNTDYSENDIIEASTKAVLHEFVMSLPDGYQTIVGDRGLRLSGGQRQRLAIARELLRKPKVLILDEATSSLDSESEREIQRSIDNLKGTVTVVIIAHRLSTITNANSILVLDRGKLIESGSFSDLREDQSSLFNRLISMQAL